MSPSAIQDDQTTFFHQGLTNCTKTLANFPMYRASINSRTFHKFPLADRKRLCTFFLNHLLDLIPSVERGSAATSLCRRAQIPVPFFYIVAALVRHINFYDFPNFAGIHAVHAQKEESWVILGHKVQ